MCWSQEPGDRPSAAGVVNMVTSPQFCHLRDVLSLGPDVGIFCGVSVPPSEISLGKADMFFEVLLMKKILLK